MFAMPRIVPAMALLLAWSLGSQHLSAQLILDFSRTETGGVRVVGTGSGTTTNWGFGRIWNSLDFDNDFISDSVGTFDGILADSVSGSISNSWGITRQIDAFAVGRSSSINDSIAFRTDRNMLFWFDQEYTFTMEAIFDVNTLAFDDLIPGTYFDTTLSDRSEIFGVTVINVQAVPEPAALGLLAGIGLTGWVAVRRKRQQQKQLPPLDATS